MSKTTSTTIEATLSEAETEVIALFVHLASVLGFPRTVGELYGLLFSSPEPLCNDDLFDRLQISNGSISQGLKLLRTLGAVKIVHIPGDRRRHYEAERNMRKIISGFMRQQVAPGLADASERLAHIDDLLKTSDAPNQEWLRQRLADLQRWGKHSERLAPLVSKLLGS